MRLFEKKKKVKLIFKKRKYHCDFSWNAVRADISSFLIFILSYFLSFSFVRMSIKHVYIYIKQKI